MEAVCSNRQRLREKRIKEAEYTQLNFQQFYRYLIFNVFELFYTSWFDMLYDQSNDAPLFQLLMMESSSRASQSTMKNLVSICQEVIQIQNYLFSGEIQ